MIRRRLALVFLFCTMCKPATQPANKTSAAAGPQTRATVVTIRTTVQPSNATTTHMLVIAGDLARSTDELDAWRLFDVKKGTVTFVDDVAKTSRTEPLQSIVKKRQAVLAQALPAHIPAAKWEPTGEKKPMLNVTAEQSLIRAGAYRRELWMAKHPAIPEQLFSMMQLSEPPSSPLAPMMRSVEAGLANTRGFPLRDKTELPYGKGTIGVERVVVGIGQRDVPKALLEVPRGYKDLTAPAANRRPAS